MQGIVRTEISAALHAAGIVAPSRNDALTVGATSYLLGYYTLENGRIRVHAVQENANTHRQVKWLDLDSDPVGGALQVGEALAKKIGDRTRPFGSKNPTAIRAWGEGLASTDAGARMAAFEKAISLDPDFGEAYAVLAETKALTGDRAGLMNVLDRARGRQNLFTDLDRARLDLMRAEVTGNGGARRTALVALSRLNTTDARTLEQLAEMEFVARRFQASADAYRNALALAPDNPTFLNQLGYAEALQGNLDRARDALERYARAEPDSANPLDSLGDACFFNGRFGEAEKYYLQAWDKQKNPAGLDLLKAAEARLMTGDTAGADAIYKRYSDVRRSDRDPLINVEGARWRYVEGRRKEAIAAMESFAKSAPGDLAAYAHAHLVIWYLVAGQPGSAQDHAAAAVQTAQAPGSRAMAVASRFLAQPRSNAAAWAAAADQTFGPGPSLLKTSALAFGLLLSRQFGPASQVFQTLYQSSSPAADGLPRTLYAWTLVETSRKVDATPLVQTYPLPFANAGEALFATLAFPRFLEVRATVLEAQGKNTEAGQMRSLYQKLRGDLPSIYDNRR